MDHVDWAVFFVAIVAFPLAAIANVRWWRKSRASELPRDWQSFWMITLGLICFISIILWYTFRFSPWSETWNVIRGLWPFSLLT